MQKFLTLVFSILFLSLAHAEGDKSGNNPAAKGYVFEDEIVLPVTSVKNQFSTNTCWSFSTLSFLESEMLRLSKPEVDLSEMYIVWHTYLEKTKKEIRLHGVSKFGPGGAFHDVTNMISKYGIVPESVYSGLKPGVKVHSHDNLDKILEKETETILNESTDRLNDQWPESIEKSLNDYLGHIPDSFYYQNKIYTPLSFAKEYVGLNMDDYVEITSYTHHPFYDKFILEVPDNWSWDKIYNVPLEDMEQIIDFSLHNGFTVAWAADVSEKGFQSDKKGVAVVPETGVEPTDDPDDAVEQKNKGSVRLNRIIPEMKIDQEMRQKAFDNYETTDDHGMHIIGIARNQDGNEFYKVKNSWGKYNRFDGYFYASKPYVASKTMSIMVNKNGIPKEIRQKLGL